MNLADNAPRKVRNACKRCRLKRVKCDGQVPACGNCTKANEACIDVDGRNNAVSIPREYSTTRICACDRADWTSFAVTARARIHWLEYEIKQMSPNFDISGGPRVDFQFLEDYEQVSSLHQPDQRFRTSSDTSLAIEARGRRSENAAEPESSTTKRPLPADHEQNSERPFTEEARSVAFDLGMLSLNSDSRQTHYLGSSSGRLFTSLVGVPSTSSTGSPRDKSTTSPATGGTISRPGPYASARQFAAGCRQLYEILKKSLPSRDDSRVLVETYLEAVHVDHPFIHVPSLLDALEALYSCEYTTESTNIGWGGWPQDMAPFSYNGEFEEFRGQNATPVTVFTATFHVFMVFTLAAIIRTREKTFDYAPSQYYKVAMHAAQQTFSGVSIASLQATLCLVVHGLLTPAEVNVWTLAHIAMAHCVDLGLHRDPRPAQLSTSSVTIRRILFHYIYHLDRSIATIQGRPLGIRDETFDVQMPTRADVETDTISVRQHAFYPDLEVADVAEFALLRFRLDPIVSEIKMLFYHLPSQKSSLIWPTDLIGEQERIRQSLDHWNTTVSELINRINNDMGEAHHRWLGNTMKLRCQYYAAMILLYQPSQAMPQPQEDHISLCYRCAVERLQTYHELYNADSLFFSWRSVQGIFSSGATMIYCLWSSNTLRRTVPYASAIRALRMCENLLSAGGEWWPSVRKGKDSFGRAMDALIRLLDVSKLPTTLDHSGPPSQVRRLGSVPEASITRQFDGGEWHHDLSHDLPTMTMPNNIPWDNAAYAPTADFDGTNITFGNTDLGHLTQYAGYFDPAVSDPTLDAFVTGFLDNGTSWNLF